MNKNEAYNIKPVMNGYKVEYSYRNTTANKDFDYRYMDEEYFFATWAEVVAWIEARPLATPPAKVGE